MIERHFGCEADALAGLTLEKIAEKHNLSKTSVHRRLVVAGLAFPRRRGKGGPHNKIERCPEIEADRKRGLSLSQIGAKYGMSKQSVLRRLELAAGRGR